MISSYKLLFFLIFFPVSMAALVVFSSPQITDGGVPTLTVLAFPKPDFVTQSKFSQKTEENVVETNFETKFVEDPELEKGKDNLIQSGNKGKTEILTTITYYDGQEYEKKVEETIIEVPVEEIIAKGSKIIPKTIETEYGSITYLQVLHDFWATSYDSTCLGCSSTTATGMRQGYGVVAVDPKVIPLYSRVYIPGYGIGIAGDVGGSVKGRQIDLGYDSLNGQWAAHKVDVYLLWK